jgi:membrane protein YqaA with SNARE-associated domain
MNLLQQLNQYLLLWGVPGLLVITGIESAAVPMMGGPDAIVLLLAWKRPMQVIPIILAATVGSTLGCMVLYRVARAGGEMALSRFSEDRRAWMKHKLDRNAFVAVAAGVAAPPPFPAKFVVLAAGAFHVRMSQFVNGVFVGRLLRYSVLAFLGARFGDQAAEVLKNHYPAFTIALAGALVAYLVVRHVRNQAKAIPGKQAQD